MWSALVAVMFPTRCPGCDAPAEPVCDACAVGLRSASRLAVPGGLDVCRAAFEYEGVARELVARVKYRRARATVPWLAARMVDIAGELGDRFDVVTWPPTTRAHRRARGFDHAELLARAVARRLALPARPLLVRTSEMAQTGRPAAQRRTGPHFGFRATMPTRVLLVDDVVTTGATLRAAARTLRAGGARYVGALVAARTPAPRSPAGTGPRPDMFPGICPGT